MDSGLAGEAGGDALWLQGTRAGIRPAPADFPQVPMGGASRCSEDENVKVAKRSQPSSETVHVEKPPC